MDGGKVTNAPLLERRFFVFGATIIFIFLVLTARLVWLQVLRGEELAMIAETNKLRLFNIYAPRGRIFDNRGSELVGIRPAFMIYMFNDLTEEEKLATIEKLTQVAGLTEFDVSELKARLDKTTRAFEPVLVKGDVDMETVVRVEEMSAELPGVYIDTQSIRHYQYESLASHILGYVGEINADELDKLREQGYKLGVTIGKLGLEKLYDEDLRGQDGARIVEVNASGHPVAENQALLKKEPVPGNDIVVTIDNRLQAATEEALAAGVRKHSKSKTGAAVVLDVETGAILAMASYPDFNPNLFARGISSEDWKKLSTDPRHVFNDRAIASAYPPASTFKMVVAAAGLETGKVTPSTTFYCPGSYTLANHTFKCWKHSGHGRTNLVKGLQVSCDVYFYNVGRLVGPDAIKYYANQFGVGELSGLGLPGESAGRIPTPEWKKAYFAGDPKQEIWYPGETINMSIGQGDVLATPLQMAMMTSTLAHDGRLNEPYLVEKIVSPNGDLVYEHQPKKKHDVDVTKAHLEYLRKGMEMVVGEGGTAVAVFRGFPVKVAGKTGTAQNSQGEDHGLFVCYAPMDKPEIAVAVVIEQGKGGSTAAAPVAREIMMAYFAKETLAPQFEGGLMQMELKIQ